MQRTYEFVKATVKAYDEKTESLSNMTVKVPFSSVDKAKDIKRKAEKALKTTVLAVLKTVRVSELMVMSDDKFYELSELKNTVESEYSPKK